MCRLGPTWPATAWYIAYLASAAKIPMLAELDSRRSGARTCVGRQAKFIFSSTAWMASITWVPLLLYVSCRLPLVWWVDSLVAIDIDRCCSWSWRLLLLVAIMSRFCWCLFTMMLVCSLVAPKIHTFARSWTWAYLFRQASLPRWLTSRGSSTWLCYCQVV